MIINGNPSGNIIAYRCIELLDSLATIIETQREIMASAPANLSASQILGDIYRTLVDLLERSEEPLT